MIRQVKLENRNAAAIGESGSLNEGSCWYKTETFRRLYPEYNDLNDHDLSEKAYSNAGRPLTHPRLWRKVTETAGLAFGVPLAVLAFGCSLTWAFSGFRRI